MSNGSKKLKWILLSPFLLLVGVVFLVVIGFALTELNKAYWDHRVDELCAKDAGVTIYEKVVISKSDYPNMKFISTGQPILPFEKMAKDDDPFFIKINTETVYKFLNLQVGRQEYLIIRNSDKKILAKSIIYGRGGGDFPNPFESSPGYLCKENEEQRKITESIIAVKGE